MARDASAPLRILFPFAGDAMLGGSHISALSLIAALDRSRFDPYILIHLRADAVGDHARALGLDFELMPDTPLMAAPGLRLPGDVGAAAYVMRTLPKLTAVLRRIKPDIVHTNEGRMHANWIFPSKLAGCRHIWHHRQDPGAKGANVLAPLLADQIVSVSHFAKPNRPVRKIDHKTQVIRSPFDIPTHQPDHDSEHAAICAELGVRPDAMLLGYFGSLVERKRPVHFIDAVAAIQAARPDRDVHGLLFGEVMHESSGVDATCRARAVEIGVADRIHLMGFRKPIDGIMAGVDVKLVTALNEPFGRTLIEAMALGTPVVATDHGGNPEAIDDGRTGFLVEPGDPASFVAPVLQLMDDPALRHRVSEAAQQDARSKYGRARHVAEVSQLYERLAGRALKESLSDVRS